MPGRLLTLFALSLLLVAVGCDSGADDAPSKIVAGSITVSTPGNLVEGRLPVGQTIEFPVRLSNTTGVVLGGMTNGLRVFSPDGAVWDTTLADTTGALGPGHFDLLVSASGFSADGSGADTIGLQGAAMQMPGMPVDFDEHAFTITIGPIPEGHGGQTICIDSSWYRPAGKWLWATGSEPSISPKWEGTYCWKIAE